MIFKTRNATIHTFIPSNQTVRETKKFNVFFENEADDETYENIHPEAQRPFSNWGEVIRVMAFQTGKSPIMEIHALENL